MAQIWSGEMFRLLTAAAISLAALTAASCGPAPKAAYPSRPVHLVVGFGVGGPDTTARLLAAELSKQTGQRFIVDNKPGSSGVIGAEFVAKSAPDGYTLLVAPASLASLPSLKKELPFNVLTGFKPVSQIGASEASFLVVPPTSRAKTLQDLIAEAKAPTGHVTYASTGIGTGSHLRMALFSAANGAPMQHVPFKSPGEAVVSIMGGETQALFLTTTQALPLIKAGKIRALAYDYPTRASFLPDVPTMTEAGAAPTNLDSGWHGLLAPAGTPDEVVDYLEAEVRKAVATPEMQARIRALGLTPVGGSSEQFAQVLAEAVKGMGEAARAAGIEPQ
jgi:tripartite-type tricarboxylate transporter receptor subunit TctC